jgi:hypothetical protein
VLGVVMGGWIFTIIGGYNSPKALPVAVIVMVIGGFCGFPIVFVSNFYLAAFLLWC